MRVDRHSGRKRGLDALSARVGADDLCGPVSDDAFGEFEFRLRKAVTDGEQRFASDGVAHVVTEVEARRVAAATEAQVGALGCVGVVSGVFDNAKSIPMNAGGTRTG